MVDIGLTLKCNNSCIMCTSTQLMQERFEEPALQQVLSKIRSIKKNAPPIVLTGGEPTLRKDIFQILGCINREHPLSEIKLITNGRMLKYGDFASRLKKIRNLTVVSEIHGPEELHDKITRAKGSFSQTLAGLKNALSSGLSTELRIVVQKMNYKNLPEIAGIIKKELPGLAGVVIFPIDLIGSARLNSASTFVEFGEFVPYIEKIIDLLKGHFNVKVYHVPFCKIKEKYHQFLEGITADKKRVRFDDFCEDCYFRQKCSGIWKSYPNRSKTAAGNAENPAKKKSDIMDISSRCSQNCIFCTYKRFNPEKDKIVGLPEGKKAINMIKNKIDHLIFVGAESTLNKNFPELLRYAKECGLSTEVSTNGIMFADEKYADKLCKYLDEVEISFHSHKKETFRKITRANSFNSVIQGINNCANRSARLKLVHVINRLNYNDLEDFIFFINSNIQKNTFGKKMRVMLAFIRPYINRGDPGFLSQRKLIPKYSEVKPALKKAVLLAKKIGIDVVLYGFPLCTISGLEDSACDYRMKPDITEVYKLSKSLNKRVYLPECKFCADFDKCPAVWPEYIDIYGYSEMRGAKKLK